MGIPACNAFGVADGGQGTHISMSVFMTLLELTLSKILEFGNSARPARLPTLNFILRSTNASALRLYGGATPQAKFSLLFYFFARAIF